jgi:peptidoglycan/xylan/chitin deacetylase (PgdA/CDA1 family)
MDKPLIKLYIILAVSIVLAVLFMPAIVGRTSAWAADTALGAKLAAYEEEESGDPLPGDKKGNVIIMFDDGYETQYTRGYEILKRSGMKAGISVIPAAVGDPGYMDYKQLADLYMAGWDMLNHTYGHIDLMGLSEDKQAEQITQGMDWLKDHQLSRGSDILIYPGGKHDDYTIEAMKASGVVAARSLKSVWSAELGCTFEDVEICNVISGLSLKNIKRFIDKAADNGSTIILVVHKIEPVTNDSQMQIEEDKLQNIVDYIAAKQDKLKVITLSELIKNYNS